LDVQLILLKVAEVVEEEIILNLLPKLLEMMEDQEEVAHLMLAILEELVLEMNLLQLLLKEMMEE
jgi:hypothetical protein|tara:strand:+ start:327 stop:521 length:195 start_codon:yes stop_codon:yes gene_type:complete